MMTPKERMATDPVFHALVKTMYDLFENYCTSGAGITPSEIREASGFAWQIYAEHNAMPWLVTPNA